MEHLKRLGYRLTGGFALYEQDDEAVRTLLEIEAQE